MVTSWGLTSWQMILSATEEEAEAGTARTSARLTRRGSMLAVECPQSQVDTECKSGQVEGQDGPGNLSCFANININTH